MFVVLIWVCRYLSSSPFSRISLTWLKTVSIGVYGSYCIELVFYSRSIRWLEDIFLYVTIKYCMIMKRLTVNFPVVLFLLSVIYFASMANMSFWMSVRSTPLVSWKTRRFLSYWSFSYSWAWRVADIGMMRFPGWTWRTKGVLMRRA